MKVKNRVKTHEDFQKVIHGSPSVSNRSYVVYFKENDLGYSRIGISASKKLGNAVVRGRVRRQVRVIAKAILGLENAMDYVIIVRKNFLLNPFGKNEEALKELYTDILNESRRKKDEEEK